MKEFDSKFNIEVYNIPGSIHARDLVISNDRIGIIIRNEDYIGTTIFPLPQYN